MSTAGWRSCSQRRVPSAPLQIRRLQIHRAQFAQALGSQPRELIQ